jgi:hypothetical protein
MEHATNKKHNNRSYIMNVKVILKGFGNYLGDKNKERKEIR